MGKNGLMKTKTYCIKYFRFGMFLPELRRRAPAGNLASAGCPFYFYFFSSCETFSNANITVCLKIERKFQFLTAKFWGLGLRNNFLKFPFLFFSTGSDIQEEKKTFHNWVFRDRGS